jgi:hypothetical protein
MCDSRHEKTGETPRDRDVFERIEDAHERIDGLLEALSEIARSPGDRSAPPRRGRVFGDVARALRAAHAIEERTLYARLDCGEPRIRQALDQHRHVERLLSELTGIAPESSRWRRKARSLRWAVELHFQHEEEVVFELARTRPDPDVPELREELDERRDD